jgi:hypothetical protein
MISSYNSELSKPFVIIHKTVVFLALTSLIFEAVFVSKTHFKLIAIQGKSGQTRAKGQCFNSQVA